jgi:polyisoprenoid-binding protein YceI
MRSFSLALAAVCLLVSGCTDTKPAPVAGPTMPAATTTPEEAGTATASDAGVSLASDAALDSLAFPITPENTRIEFIGTHVGEKPDPRKGRFEKFTGKLDADPTTKKLLAVSLEIDTSSLMTDIDKLTEHLKSPDFFDVREHPKATFESTKIAPSAEGEGLVTITGKLTLHGVTKEITLPATVELGESPKLRSEFTIDRSEFGMTFSPDRVENKVALTVVIGEQPATPQP